MTITATDNWTIPEGLNEHGSRAAELIRNFCLERHRTSTEQQVFHDPKTWDRSEYGKESVLVVLHEGGDHDSCINLDGAYENGPRGDCYRLYEALDALLRKNGLYLEQCYRWHSAVYCL